MDGIAATLDETENFVKPSIAARDLRSKVRDQVQLAEPNNVGHVEAGEFFVVGNVEENAFRIRLRRHACYSFPILWN